jgi:hypothetical protein
MYILAGQSRIDTSETGAHSDYCKPWGSALTDALDGAPDDPKGALLTALYGSRACGDGKVTQANQWKEGQGGSKHATPRYRGMNLAPWVGRWRLDETRYDAKKGRVVLPGKGRKLASDSTVEFRLHRASADPAVLVPWICLLTRIVDYVASATDRDVARLPASGMRTLARIAPDLAPYLVNALRAYRVRHNGNRKIRYHQRAGYVIGNHRGLYDADALQLEDARIAANQSSLPFGGE